MINAGKLILLWMVTPPLVILGSIRKQAKQAQKAVFFMVSVLVPALSSYPFLFFSDGMWTESSKIKWIRSSTNWFRSWCQITTMETQTESPIIDYMIGTTKHNIWSKMQWDPQCKAMNAQSEWKKENNELKRYIIVITILLNWPFNESMNR